MTKRLWMQTVVDVYLGHAEVRKLQGRKRMARNTAVHCRNVCLASYQYINLLSTNGQIFIKHHET